MYKIIVNSQKQTYSAVVNDFNYFAHHGIKGQKWGVRRFQNEDGSYTAAGDKRYNNRKSDGSIEPISKNTKNNSDRNSVKRRYEEVDKKVEKLWEDAYNKMNSRFVSSKREKTIREKRDQMIEDTVMNNLALTMRETGKKMITLDELRKSGYQDHEMYDRLMEKQFNKKDRPDIEAGYFLKDGSFRTFNNFKEYDRYYDQISTSAYKLKE